MKHGPYHTILLIAVFVCLGPLGQSRADYVTMVDNGPSSNRIDMVFLGDGYTASQIETAYVSHIQSMLDHMFVDNEDPFPRYRNFFNVHRVNVISNESGADVPPEGIYRDTALDASYYYDGVTARLLYVNTGKANTALNNGLAGAGFSAEMKLVTVNDTRYGGGGGSYAVYAGGNGSAPEVALHELGHSFSRLADEYVIYDRAYEGGEPSQVNVTTSPTGEKWARWLGYTDPDHPQMSSIGACEGAYYYRYGIYRPSQSSKMRSLGWPFDAVGREKIILDIYDYVDPLDNWLDNSVRLVNPVSLWVDVVDPDVVQMEWLVDGEAVDGVTDESFSPLGLGRGEYTITAHAYDDTPWVRIATDALDQSVSWTVLVTVPEPTTLTLTAIGGFGLCLVSLLRRKKRA